MPSRRHVLATLGATLTAGCTAPDSTTPASTTTSPTTRHSTTTSTPTTTEPPSEFEAITATRSFVYLYASAHHAAYTSPDTTFVFARATTQVDPANYAVDAGDRQHSARSEVGGQSVSSLVGAIPEGDGTLLAFAVEGALAPADATLQGPDQTVALPEAVRAFLREPPKCNLRAFTVPDAAPVGREVDVSLTVDNRGNSPGTFRANVGSTALSGQPVTAFDVPANQSRTVEVPVTLYGTGDTETIRCAWGVDEQQRTLTRTG